MGTGPTMEPGAVVVSMGFNILCRNVHTGLGQERGPEPIGSYSASTILCTTPGINPTQYEVSPLIAHTHCIELGSEQGPERGLEPGKWVWNPLVPYPIPCPCVVCTVNA